MAPETRIGLVVGLAFIICFAIILANKGERERSMTPWLPVAGDTTKVHPAGRPVTLPSGSSSLKPSTPRYERDMRSASLSATHGIQTAGLLGSNSVTPPVAVPVRFGASSQHVSPAPSRPGLKIPAGLASNAATPQRVVPRQASGPRSASPAVAAPKRVVLRRMSHTVVKGDTLSKTAQTYYGRPTNKIIRAIYEANRTVLSSPDVLPLGAKIILPVVEGLSPKEASAAQLARPSAEPGGKAKGRAAEPGKAFRWYQIRKQDRYASIAREQLGDASRWGEIYELNRSKFPDADRIREGVRIKLPLTAMAAADGR